VARFLDSHERVRVANHCAALPPQALPPATEEAVAAATPGLYASACQQCHGVEGIGTGNGPPLNARPAFHVTRQLQDWQVSKRRNAPAPAASRTAPSTGSRFHRLSQTSGPGASPQ